MKSRVSQKFLSTIFVVLLILGSIVPGHRNVYALSSEKINGIDAFSNKLNLPFEKVKEHLCFKENCYLVPLMNIDEHKNCLINIFSDSNPDYMKYYLSGKLFSRTYVEESLFGRSLKNMWDDKLPRSITFIIDCDNESVGRIGIGPLDNRNGIDCEIGYAINQSHSGKGYMSAAVRSSVKFLQYILENNNSVYKFKKLRATAKISNEPSNRILINAGFIKSKNLVDDGYGLENEYFYYFN